MGNRHGDFIWYELLTSDAHAAADFYGRVVGWQARAAEGSDRDYRIFMIDGTDVAGFMTTPADVDGQNKMRPRWLGYVGVDNVDATALEIVQAGGAQHIPPTDIPGVGRFAMVSDPQGISFYVLRGATDGTSTSFSQTESGHCHWNELATSDQGAALAFYGGIFGWERGDAMPMGDAGTYQFIIHGGGPMGAMMTRSENGPPPGWTFYFGVADIDVAAKSVSAGGGTIHYGPAEVPGGVYIIVATDPQGALFGLVGPRRQ